MTPISRFCICLGFVVFGSVAQAQSTPSADDLRALRFYIEQDDTTSVTAEIRRLQTIYPQWSPPQTLTDLLQTQPTTQLDDIYARIARNDLNGARRVLAETRTAFPSWTPPENINTLINLAQGQIDFDAAIGRRDMSAAIALASTTPDLLRCDRINNTWQLADLQTAAGNDAAALAAFSQIVRTCTAVPDLIATIEKANAVASVEEMRGLVATAQQRLPAAAAQFAALEARLLAGRGVTTTAPAGSQATPSPTPTPTATPTPQAATPTPPASTAMTTAQPAAVSPAPATAPPLSALRLSGDNRLNGVRSAARAENFAECAARSVQPRSLDVAYERAWCVFNLDRPLESLALFTAASAISGSVGRDARYGMALSYLRRDMTDAASQLAATTDFLPEQRRTVESIILDQRGVRAYQQEDYPRAILFFDGLERLEGGLRRDLAILRAYAYLNSGDRATARAEFRRLDDELSTEETRTGLRASLG